MSYCWFLSFFCLFFRLFKIFLHVFDKISNLSCWFIFLLNPFISWFLRNRLINHFILRLIVDDFINLIHNFAVFHFILHYWRCTWIQKKYRSSSISNLKTKVFGLPLTASNIASFGKTIKSNSSMLASVLIQLKWVYCSATF